MNYLNKETSPYLLQHAHNPVHWYAWKAEAFERAVAENKPILVSIGYSTCHWCHVMERESFEDQATADFMNEHFINIKVDREERPDVDQIYMEACQAISGSGGWPLNCFLLPDGRPFYAGTYFPPTNAYNRPSWLQVLRNLSNAFHNGRATVEEQAAKLTDFIKKSDTALLANAIPEMEAHLIFTPVLLDNIFYQLKSSFDTEEGGFGGAPKFPGSMNIQYLLNHYFYTHNKEALNHALFSLDKMIMGGIYDQIGGGFARYATDKAWLIPHFEKMLYDNALLISVLADAYKITQKELYKATIEETLNFVAREMTSEEGGFYAALDADSEGVEGKFYVWTKTEIDQLLGEEAELFNAFYDVQPNGNWEGHTILNRNHTLADFAKATGIEPIALKNQFEKNKAILLAARAERIRPSLDDKILLSWNALMCTAYAKAYSAIPNKAYKQAATRNLDFLLEKFTKSDGISLYHTYKNGQRQYDAFLDDYAFLIEALIENYNNCFDLAYLEKAFALTNYVLEHFWDEKEQLFFYTSKEQSDIILRKKELYDSAMPSGNSTMLRNLQQLAVLYDESKHQDCANAMLLKVKTAVERYPTSFGRWATAMQAAVKGTYEIAVVGATAKTKAPAINAIFIPNKVIMAATEANNRYPLLEGRYVENETQIYLCSNYRCQKPVTTVAALKDLLMNK